MVYNQDIESTTMTDLKTFAGFKIPRTENGPTLYNYATKSLAQRLAEYKRHGRGCIGQVTFALRIRDETAIRGDMAWGFYLPIDGADAMGLRWAWCDHVGGTIWDDGPDVPDITHTGWFCDDVGDDTIRGIVAVLPRSRGYLAGWSMGEGMASMLHEEIHEELDDAVRAADEDARIVAESEREYRAEHDGEE